MSEINESTRIINLTEASEMDAGMNFVTDSSNGTRKVPITKLIDANLEDEYAAAPAKAVGDLKEDLHDYTDAQKAEVIRKMQRVESYNVFKTSNIQESYSYNKSGSGSSSSTYNCTKDIIPVEENDVVRFYYIAELNAARVITAYNSSGTAVSASGAENVSSYTVPTGITGIRVTYYKNSNVAPMITINYEATEYQEHFESYYIGTTDFTPDLTDLVNSIKIARSGNVLDTTTLEAGKAINSDGSLSTNASYATTGYIAVNENDVVTVTYSNNDALSIARLVTFDENKTRLTGNTTGVTTFTVPSSVAYIRFSVSNTYLTNATTRVNLDGQRHIFEPFYEDTVSNVAQANGTNISAMLRYPLSTFPEYIVNNLAYKPLGVLSKGYICFVSDDGDADVASYTIPTFISKDVPCTLAMMSTSEVFETDAGTNTVLDAVNNHGFCVAQHGGSYWPTNYNEYSLSLFFDSELTFWNSLSITPHGACAPGHQVTDWIRAMCGGRFGCHRAAYYDGTPYYEGNLYMNGPRSNMYSLTSVNIVESTLDVWKNKCDLALSNHYLLMIHMHENELDSDDKTKLEAVIDYALSIGLTFCTMKDIPTIV